MAKSWLVKCCRGLPKSKCGCLSVKLDKYGHYKIIQENEKGRKVIAILDAVDFLNLKKIFEKATRDEILDFQHAVKTGKLVTPAKL